MLAADLLASDPVVSEPQTDPVAEAMHRADPDSTAVVSRVRARLFGNPPPRKLGRYELGPVLGRGGLGVVHRAYDPNLDREIAVKVHRDSSGDDDAQRARMVREARALARLNHRNVVAVHDSGMTEDGVFVAMELVEGVTLSRWLELQARSPQEILGCLIAAGEGLHAAHRAGIVHRDVKPANILVDANGHVKVVDFGLARAAGFERGGSPRGVLDVDLTATGTLVGTPAYMAPEQFEGRIDARTDQWALCVTAWEALVGERPFAADSIEALRRTIGAGSPTRSPPRGVPTRVWSAIERGLSVDPDARHPSVGALLAALRDPPTRRRPWVAPALGVGLASVALVAALAGDRTDPKANGATDPADEVPPRIEVHELAAAWTTPNQVRWAWKPEGDPDDLAEYVLLTGPTETSVQGDDDSATRWTSRELPELGRFLRPRTGNPEPVSAVTTYAHAPDTMIYARLIAIDTQGRRFRSGIARSRTAPAPAGAIVLFEDDPPGGYSLPDDFALASTAPRSGERHFRYTARCPEPPCWANLRRKNLAHSLEAVAPGVFSTTAHIELSIAVDGTGPAWWSALRLWLGDGNDESLIAYFDGFAVTSDGHYHTLQVPLRAFHLDGRPLTHDRLAAGLHEWGVGGSWPDGATVRIDDVAIRW